MTGLRQRILSAASAEEVTKLMDEGNTYEFASVKTKNSWSHAAKRVGTGAKYTPTVTTPAKKRKVRRSR
jgi:deoxyribose-phosphate aldolase